MEEINEWENEERQIRRRKAAGREAEGGEGIKEVRVIQADIMLGGGKM